MEGLWSELPANRMYKTGIPTHHQQSAMPPVTDAKIADYMQRYNLDRISAFHKILSDEGISLPDEAPSYGGRPLGEPPVWEQMGYPFPFLGIQDPAFYEAPTYGGRPLNDRSFRHLIDPPDRNQDAFRTFMSSGSQAAARQMLSTMDPGWLAANWDNVTGNLQGQIRAMGYGPARSQAPRSRPTPYSRPARDAAAAAATARAAAAAPPVAQGVPVAEVQLGAADIAYLREIEAREQEEADIQEAIKLSLGL